MKARILVRYSLLLAVLAGACMASAQSDWTTVVNNGSVMPGSNNVVFNSYNQPSINARGTVVFRARSKGGSGNDSGGNEVNASGPVHGIYMRNMLRGTATIRVFDKTSVVPQPNNTGATFTEFPTFPRIDQLTNTVVTRGASQPVWTYSLNGTDTKVGTSGVYVVQRGDDLTANSQLGVVPEYSFFQVPGVASGLRFDQFPGAPAVSGSSVAFKGNYTEVDVENNTSLSKTGVYFRNIIQGGGVGPVQRIADTSTLIPGTTTPFGATAPPSAASGTIVFTGWDNEDSPTMGGIYRAPLRSDPALATLVGIGTQVPGEASGVTFTNFGENLAFDGRFVAFWASWGTEKRYVNLTCPTDGNKDLIAYCLSLYPNSVSKEVPAYQGIFVYDGITRRITALAKTPTNFDDFLYWVFSGKPPGTGNTDENLDGEPARWRSAAFAAVSGRGSTFQAVFKAKKNTVDGIYHVNGATVSQITTLLDTTMSGQAVDPQAPAGSTVVSLGVEREGLRANWLVITASMLNTTTSESWAGVYTQNLR
ncbi:MAG TPA: hypothetical protein VND66_04405 [Acidobacteriaceae bacterium]|nr:hypothetical protein [Acidobacteriaceae bacterium]